MKYCSGNKWNSKVCVIEICIKKDKCKNFNKNYFDYFPNIQFFKSIKDFRNCNLYKED